VEINIDWSQWRDLAKRAIGETNRATAKASEKLMINEALTIFR
jgi:hypothetical protein